MSFDFIVQLSYCLANTIVAAMLVMSLLLGLFLVKCLHAPSVMAKQLMQHWS